MTHAQQPNAKVPEEWKDAILHARMELGGEVLLASDVPADRFAQLRDRFGTSWMLMHERQQG